MTPWPPSTVQPQCEHSPLVVSRGLHSRFHRWHQIVMRWSAIFAPSLMALPLADLARHLPRDQFLEATPQGLPRGPANRLPAIVRQVCGPESTRYPHHHRGKRSGATARASSSDCELKQGICAIRPPVRQSIANRREANGHCQYTARFWRLPCQSQQHLYSAGLSCKPSVNRYF